MRNPLPSQLNELDKPIESCLNAREGYGYSVGRIGVEMLSWMDELRAKQAEWLALENYMAICHRRSEIPFERNVIEQAMWQTFRMPYDERIWSEYKALIAAVESKFKDLLAGAASVLRLLHNHGAQARR